MGRSEQPHHYTLEEVMSWGFTHEAAEALLDTWNAATPTSPEEVVQSARVNAHFWENTSLEKSVPHTSSIRSNAEKYIEYLTERDSHTTR